MQPDRKCTDYEITDYGIDHGQYFQGHGTSYTSYDYCALGVGNDYNEALADALDQAEPELDLTPEDAKPVESESVSDLLKEQGEEEEEECDNCELYYYVGLRWNKPKEENV